MTNWAARLYQIANKTERIIVGLMSGTSLDGVDIAVCQLKGTGYQTKLQVIHHKTIPYNTSWKTNLKSLFAKSRIDMQELCLVNAELGRLHGQWLKKALAEWGIDSSSVDLVASHGQTVFHAPKHFHGIENRPNSTLQVGDGDHVAAQCGIITVSDFRQRHVAQGGEGAPLVLYGDKLLFSSNEQSRLLVNLGGIANFTWLPKGQPSAAIASDSGPANTLLDSYCQQYLNLDFDENGAIARSGKVNKALLEQMLNAEYFVDLFVNEIPKTTGPEQFNLGFFEQAKQAIACEQLSHSDALATLLAFTVGSLKLAVRKVTQLNKIDAIFCSGGGVQNGFLMQAIGEAFAPIRVTSISEMGLHSDAKEAALFAVLANECIAGDSSSTIDSITMGKVCFPH